MSGANSSLDDVRELLCAVEYLRSACEHANGQTETDRLRLSRAMSVGIVVAQKHGAQFADYQHDSFWREVNALPKALGISKEIES